jgi:hypothetical protein
VRWAITIVALLFTALLAFLTLYVLFKHGPDLLVLLSLAILALFGIGIFGALGRPPEDRR